MAMVRKRPKYESERKAPTRGMKLVAATHMNNTVCPFTTPKP